MVCMKVCMKCYESDHILFTNDWHVRLQIYAIPVLRLRMVRLKLRIETQLARAQLRDPFVFSVQKHKPNVFPKAISKIEVTSYCKLIEPLFTVFFNFYHVSDTHWNRRTICQTSIFHKHLQQRGHLNHDPWFSHAY